MSADLIISQWFINGYSRTQNKLWLVLRCENIFLINLCVFIQLEYGVETGKVHKPPPLPLSPSILNRTVYMVIAQYLYRPIGETLSSRTHDMDYKKKKINISD